MLYYAAGVIVVVSPAQRVDPVISGYGRSTSALTDAVLQVDALSACPWFFIAPTASVPSQLNRDDARFVFGVLLVGPRVCLQARSSPMKSLILAQDERWRRA